MEKLDEVFTSFGETLTVEEVADLLKLKKETVWTMLRTEDRAGNKISDPLPGYKVGKTWVVVKAELREWMLRRRNTNF